MPAYSGPSHSPSTITFGELKQGGHYELTVWFPIDHLDNFTASIAQSYGGVLHITKMQAWWLLGGCKVGSPVPDCFDSAIGGAGTLANVDEGEVVGVTVSLDPGILDTFNYDTQLVVSGSGWTEQIPVTANVTVVGPNPLITATVSFPHGPIDACPGNVEPECTGGLTSTYQVTLTNIGDATAYYTGGQGISCLTPGWSGPLPPCTGTLAPGASTNFPGFGYVSCDPTPGSTETVTSTVWWGANAANEVHTTNVHVDATILTCNLPTPVHPSCGGNGQSCCNGSSCNSGLSCQGGACETPPVSRCGGQGQTCCSGSKCDSAFTCQGGTCELPCNVACYVNPGYGCGLPVGKNFCPIDLPSMIGDYPACCGPQCLSSTFCR